MDDSLQVVQGIEQIIRDSLDHINRKAAGFGRVIIEDIGGGARIYRILDENGVTVFSNHMVDAIDCWVDSRVRFGIPFSTKPRSNRTETLSERDKYGRRKPRTLASFRR